MKSPRKPKKKRNPRRAAKQKFPRGWDEERVRRVIEHYDKIAEDDLVAEDEAAFSMPGETTISVPTELIPAVLKLIAKHQKSA